MTKAQKGSLLNTKGSVNFPPSFCRVCLTDAAQPESQLLGMKIAEGKAEESDADMASAGAKIGLQEIIIVLPGQMCPLQDAAVNYIGGLEFHPQEKFGGVRNQRPDFVPLPCGRFFFKKGF